MKTRGRESPNSIAVQACAAPEEIGITKPVAGLMIASVSRADRLLDGGGHVYLSAAWSVRGSGTLVLEFSPASSQSRTMVAMYGG